MLGIFSCFCCRLLTFRNNILAKNSLRNTFSVAKGMDPDQDRRSVGPDLDTNFLQRLSADDKSLLARKELQNVIINIMI